MIAAALYCRRSNAQHVADEARSVRRQEENARAYAIKKGWTVPDEYVFKDDGKSGAEFERRPGLQRLLALLTPRAPFQILVVAEQKAIGREMSETAYIIKQLAQAGVEVWSYMEDRSLTPRNPTAKLLSMVQGYSDEDHRVKSAERMHEAMVRLASKGFSTGGRVFGLRNKYVYSGVDASGNPLRSHVDREINDAEAVVVRRIFELYADGVGLKSIAKQLNAEHAPCPKYSPPKDGLPPIDGWAPSTVKAILKRPLYAGRPEWNRSRKRDSWGAVGGSARPESEWIRAEREDLRIVSDELYARVQSRRADVAGRALRFESGRLSGRPPKYASRTYSPAWPRAESAAVG